MNPESVNIHNPHHVPFCDMAYHTREHFRANFKRVEWYSTDDGEWRKPPFKEPGKMNKEAYRIPPAPQRIVRRRNG